MPEAKKTMDAQEFKFPDEQGQNQQAQDQNQIEIEIEDDTPEVDRGKTPMPKPLVEELEKDELDQYDENVKVKLKQMRKVWHDERREKEAALREQQEAVRAAQMVLEENKRLKNVLSVGEKEYATTIQNAAAMELEMAKRAQREAYDAGDAMKLSEATQKVSEATVKVAQAKAFRLPPSLHEQQNVVQTQPVPAQQQYEPVPRPDEKALSWQAKNRWFGANKVMTATALGVHEDLMENGVPVGSDEYYAQLDKTMRRRFPEVFEEEQTPQRTEGRSRTAPVVAPATRSTAPNKLRLRASQVQLAKKLGLTPEQYAREVLKLEARNG